MGKLKKRQIRFLRRVVRLRNIIFSKYISLIIIVSGIVFILIGVIIFFWKSNFTFGEAIQSDKIGQFGDLIGGVVGSIWALAGVILFYSALTLQRKEFRLQRQELKDTRKVFKNNPTILEYNKGKTLFLTYLKTIEVL